MKNLIIQTAEPFFFPGGPTGCLLIHGFTGTPKEMLWMGEFLSKRGFTVMGIRLAGHATNPEDMRRTRWWDWIASVEDGITLLRGAARQIYTIGLSMGGVLSLLAASRYPINGAIAISTPFDLPKDWRLPFIRPISIFMRNVGKGTPDWQNLEASKDHIDYPYYPTRSIMQLRELITMMRGELSQVKVPALFFQSKLDKGIPTESMDALYNGISSTDKNRIWVDHSGHVIIREPDREFIFSETRQFLKRKLNGE